MKMAIKSSKSKPGVEFPYGVRLFSKAEVVVPQLWYCDRKTANI